jgi:hypothetical protein
VLGLEHGNRSVLGDLEHAFPDVASFEDLKSQIKEDKVESPCRSFTVFFSCWEMQPAEVLAGSLIPASGLRRPPHAPSCKRRADSCFRISYLSSGNFRQSTAGFGEFFGCKRSHVFLPQFRRQNVTSARPANSLWTNILCLNSVIKPRSKECVGRTQMSVFLYWPAPA